MGTELALFYVFAGVAVAASLMVVLRRNPMHSVLLLIVSFGALAGLYIGLDAPFAAVVQILQCIAQFAQVPSSIGVLAHCQKSCRCLRKERYAIQ